MILLLVPSGGKVVFENTFVASFASGAMFFCAHKLPEIKTNRNTRIA
jgi:hypothetical protein